MSEWKARRFWKEAIPVEKEEGHTVLLDGRPIRTPAKAVLTLPSPALAAEIAREWAAQDDVIDPLSMPATRAANAAIDKVVPQRDAVVSGIAEYADCDLTCYRADSPAELVRRQVEAWDPLLDWTAETFGARLIPVEGVMHMGQNAAALARIRTAVEAFSPFELTALSELVSLSGSLVIGLAAAEAHLPPPELWRRSRIDEDWQQEKWGIDDEAARDASARETAFLQAWRFFQLTRNTSLS